GADLQCGNRQLQVIDRARGAGPMQDVVDGTVDVDVVGDVVLDEREVPVRQVRYVGRIAGQQVVDSNDRVVAIEECLCEVRSDEPGGAGDDHPLLSRHVCGRTRGAA